MTDAELPRSPSTPAQTQPVTVRLSRSVDGAPLGPSERVLLHAALGLRWAGLALGAVVVISQRAELQRPATPQLALFAMAFITVGLTVGFRRHPSLLLHPTVLAAELTIAVAVRAADGWAFGPHHDFTTSLGVVWALGAVMTVGIAWGPRAGLAAGLVVTAGGWLGTAAPDLRGPLQLLLRDDPSPLLPILTAGALYATAGFGTGFTTHLLRRSQGQLAELRARQQVASLLHDSTLQALAYISRRAADSDIARVARDADTELRGYLTATLTPDTGDLRNALFTAARRVEHQLDGQLRLALDDELPDRPAPVIAAVTGAVTEALTNSAKHANAAHVTLYAAEDANGIRLTVIDDGDGFHPDSVPAGGGLDQSIRARLRAVGGTASIRSTPGTGTEVELWVP